MAEPKHLKLSRPYRTVEEYIAAEGWTIDSRGMVLLDQEKMASGTVVRFEIVLASGEKPIRAEGRVVGFSPAKADRPGGVRVRFRKLGPNCKPFIDGVLAGRGQRVEASVETSSPIASIAPLAEPTPPPEPTPLTPVPEDRRSGIHVRGPVEAPPNREELLQRLRDRRRGDH